MKRVRLFAVLSAVVLALAFAGCKGTTDGPENSGNTENQGNQGNQGNEGNQGNQEDPPAPVVYQFHETVTVMDAGTDGSAGTSATYVLFGDWPQTIKAEDVEVDDDDNAETTITRGDFTYYLGNDNNYYVKCTENALYGDYHYSNGDEVKRISENSTQFFMVQPIKWRVVDNNYSGKRLLLAETILTAHRFDNDSCVYDVSEIRAWLNDNFLNSAFTNDGKTRVLEIEVDNSISTTFPDGEVGSNSNVCGITRDKVFMLSKQEVTKTTYGFMGKRVDDPARVRLVNDYALANSSSVSSNGATAWWTRSPSQASDEAASVTESGYASSSGYVGAENGGVVPALCVAAN